MKERNRATVQFWKETKGKRPGECEIGAWTTVMG